MIRETTLRIAHAPPDLRWAEGTTIEGVRLRRYAAHAAILFIVALSALAAL